MTSPRAGSRWRSPSAASPVGSAPPITLPDGLDPFGEAPGRAFIVSGSEEALRGLAVIGRVGGSALALEGVLEVEVSRLAAARSGGLVRFM